MLEKHKIFYKDLLTVEYGKKVKMLHWQDWMKFLRFLVPFMMS